MKFAFQTRVLGLVLLLLVGITSLQPAHAQVQSRTTLGAVAEAADLLYRDQGGMKSHYSQGWKHLAYVRADLLEWSASGAQLGGSVFIDLDDYYSALHPDQEITGEGRSGWVTVWLELEFGFAHGIPVGMGITQVPMSEVGKDPSGIIEVEGPEACAGVLKVGLFRESPDGFEVAPADLSCVDLEVNYVSAGLNARKVEVQRTALDLMLESTRLGSSPAPTVDQLEKVSTAILNHAFQIRDGQIVPRGPAALDWRDFTESEDSSEPSTTSPFSFKLGFAALASLVTQVVGYPLEEEHYSPNGDSIQQTTTGLMVWRKADNWTAFTNGSMTWINGPAGVQSRPNDQRFDWEKAPSPQPEPAPQPPAAPAAPLPSPLTGSIITDWTDHFEKDGFLDPRWGWRPSWSSSGSSWKSANGQLVLPGGGGWLSTNDAYAVGDGWLSLEIRAQTSSAGDTSWALSGPGIWDWIASFRAVQDDGLSAALGDNKQVPATKIGLPSTDPTAWHTYRIDVTRSEARFFVDDQLAHSASLATQFVDKGFYSKPVQVLLSSGAGGELRVDWVRLKQGK